MGAKCPKSLVYYIGKSENLIVERKNSEILPPPPHPRKDECTLYSPGILEVGSYIANSNI